MATQNWNSIQLFFFFLSVKRVAPGAQAQAPGHESVKEEVAARAKRAFLLSFLVMVYLVVIYFILCTISIVFIFCCVCVCVCVCVFIKLHITAQSGPVILVILCRSH